MKVELFIVGTPTGRRLVEGAEAALEWAGNGYPVVRVVSTEKVTAEGLAIEDTFDRNFVRPRRERAKP